MRDIYVCMAFGLRVGGPTQSCVIFATTVMLMCSGHGFKLAAVVGKILGDLSVSGRSNYDLSHFAMSRFSASKL